MTAFRQPTIADQKLALLPNDLSLNGLSSKYQWHIATWADYVAYRDRPNTDRLRVFFHNDRLWVLDMGWEGIDHAGICDLFTMLLVMWFSQIPGQLGTSLGRCLLEKPSVGAGAPDLVLYLGDDYPRWQPGQPRRIDLNQWRVPNLVGEISDTTLAADLDENKQLYAALGIPEYWVVDVRGQRVIAFLLQSDGHYQEVDRSVALAGLPISLLEETLARLATESNIGAALWFSQQLSA